MDKIQAVRHMIETSHYLVALQGISTSFEEGCPDYRNWENAYHIEEKYGYSPEEMFNTSFYNTRVEQFFEYYKDVVLAEPGLVGPGVQALKTLEDEGYLKGIVTREIYHLAVRAGCSNVQELHGSIYHNFCPRCRREYPLSYIKNSKGVPLCDKCHVPIRPGVCLVGEMIDNAVLTKAASMVSMADMLLIVGCNLTDHLAKGMLKYFNGDRVVLIHEQEHFSDNKADFVIYGKPSEILPKLC